MGSSQSVESAPRRVKPMSKEELQQFRKEQEGNIDGLVTSKLPAINKKILTRFAKLQREHYNASEWVFKYTLPLEEDLEFSAQTIVNQLVSTLSTELEDYKVEATLGEELEVTFKISLAVDAPVPTSVAPPNEEKEKVKEKETSSSSSSEDSSS